MLIIGDQLVARKRRAIDSLSAADIEALYVVFCLEITPSTFIRRMSNGECRWVHPMEFLEFGWGHYAALRPNSRRRLAHRAEQCAALTTIAPFSGHCGVSAVSFESIRKQRCRKLHALKAPPYFC